MFSDDLPHQPVPLTDPGPAPESVERAEMRSVLLRHVTDGANCRAGGNPPDHTGYCWAARVAYERLTSDWRK